MIKKSKDPSLMQLSAPYQKLLQIISNIDSVQLVDWTIMHSLAYICYKYKEKFNSDYILSYDNSPSKSYEYKLCSRIWGMLSAKACEGEKVKDYIDWFYENYNSKNPFRSVGALAKADLVSKYLQQKQKQEKITMYTVLPNEILLILNEYEQYKYIKTYGDLYYCFKAGDLIQHSAILHCLLEIEEA